MNAFAGEALFIGITEGCKLAACALIAVALFRATDRGFLAKPLLAGICAALFMTPFAFTAAASPQTREFVSDSIAYLFGVFYLLALVSYALHVRGIGREAAAFLSGTAVLSLIVGVLALCYSGPDLLGSSLYLRDISVMSGQPVTVIAAGCLGFCLAVTGAVLLSRRLKFDIAKFFGWPQFMLLLAMVKLFGGGAHGFSGFTLIPSVQKGMIKFVHDAVHHTLVTLMVPDHPVLSVTTWNFIGLFFSETVALWLSLAIFTAPLLFMLRVHATAPISVPWDIASGAQSRKYRKNVRDARVFRSLPLVLFLVFIAGTWFVERNEAGSVQVSPVPLPVVAEAGKVTIPLSGPGMNLRDGGMHKFSLDLNGDLVRLLIMKRPDGALAVCLDACEICPPEGYVLGRGRVICRYCSTPIPVDTLGQPGGCNPVPVRALVTQDNVIVDLSDIASSWGKVTVRQSSGRTEK